MGVNSMHINLLDTDIDFTDPCSSWQKGAVENANRLIRQCIPKSSNIKQLTDMDIENIRNKINARPRKKTQFLNTTRRVYQLFDVNLHLLVEFAPNEKRLKMLNLYLFKPL